MNVRTLFTAMVVLSASLATAQLVPCEHYPVLEESQIGGAGSSIVNFNIVRHGDHVVALGRADGVRVFDVSDALAPELVADWQPDPYWSGAADQSFDLTLNGDVGYVSGAVYAVPVLDLHDPLNPVEINRIDMLFEVRDHLVDGDLLYTATYGRRTYSGVDTALVYVHDITDPTAPVKRSLVLEDASVNHLCLALQGDVLLSGGWHGLRSYDVSDPDNVVFVSELDQIGLIEHLVCHDGLLYATASGRLAVFDVSDPAAMVEIARVEGHVFGADNLIIHDDRAFLSLGSAMHVVDVSSPGEPGPLLRWPSLDGCYDVLPWQDQLLVCSPDELKVVAPEYPDPLFEMGRVEYETFADEQIMRDGLLYVLNGSYLHITDVSEPFTPVPLASFTDGRNYNILALDGATLFMGDLGDDGLAVVDVSDPANPVKVSWLPTQRIYSLHADNGRLALGPRSTGLVELYDTSDPSSLQLLGTYQVEESVQVHEVILAGDRMVVSSLYTHVLDISDPSNIVSLGNAYTRYGQAVCDWPWIYVGDWQYLLVLRYTDEAGLEEMAQLPYPNEPRSMDRDGDMLALGCYTRGTLMVDVSVPDAPRLAGVVPAWNYVEQVSFDNNVLAIGSKSYTEAPTAVLLYPTVCVSTGVGEPVPAPGRLQLRAQPNPFNPAVTLRFTVPQLVDGELSVYDARGRLVSTLARGPFSAGDHAFQWYGRDDAGRMVASGSYLVRLRAGDWSEARGVTLLK